MMEEATRKHRGVSRKDIFGEATGPEPATPGSYGRSPIGFRLPNETLLGPVRLQIADLSRSIDYYQQVLGLQILARTNSAAHLGTRSGTELVEIRERKGGRPAPRRGRTGLFHFAILLPDRRSLGRFARRLRQLRISAGAADHLVSEALYLQDPDNLGIEVYADRPQQAWRRVGRELMMATDPIDMDGLLESAGDEPWRGIPAGARMGHVHLHVDDLGKAAAFFSEALGFDQTVWGYPGALFLSAGAYHHHLGTNLWAGPGATKASPDEAQLLEWTIDLPNPTSLKAATDSLKKNRHDLAWYNTVDSGLTASVCDPWGTAVRLRTPQIKH